MINDQRVVLGRLGRAALRGDTRQSIEEAMTEGPSTIRPSLPLRELIGRIVRNNQQTALVTTAEGHVIGLVHRTDAERQLIGESHHTSSTPEWKRAQQAIRDSPERSRTLQHHATVLLVESVPATIAYYRDTLGFEIEPYKKIPDHYAFAQRDNCSVHFAHWDNVAPRPNSAVVPPDMFDVYVYVDDVDGLHTELVGRGAEVIQAPTRQGYGTYEIRVRDPNGYILAFGSQR